MVWIAVPAVGLIVGGAFTYLFGPSIKALFGPDFEPAPKDDQSTLNASVPRVVDGGGSGLL